jgi:hypothetical protein
MLPTRKSKTRRFPALGTDIPCNEDMYDTPSLGKADGVVGLCCIAILAQSADRGIGIPSGLVGNTRSITVQ